MADVAARESTWPNGPNEPFGTPAEIAYERRSQETALYVGGKLAIVVFGMLFAALAFSYFYLRTSNSEDLWRPDHITAPMPVGAWIMGFSVAAAVVYWYAVSRYRRGMHVDWEIACWTSVALTLAAVGLQSWQFSILPFSPGSSGYSSIFIAWAGLNIVLLLTVAFWTETLAARCARLRFSHPGEAESVPEGEGARRVLTSTRYAINVGAASGFWIFAAGVFILFWVFMYLL
ncbi:MAG: hypothetical protein ACRDXC_13970 [Acidimicrobiales bacterium]